MIRIQCNILLDNSRIEKYDSQGMHKIYDKWSDIAQESFESNQKTVNFESVKDIIFVGMGGSGAIGDIFSSILSKTKIHVNVVKGYLLPQTVDSKTLVIVVSVSGNTDETLTILDSANKIGCKIIAFSSGGKIQEYCQQNKIEYRFVKKYHSPRASFTSYLYSMLKVLYSCLEINQDDIIESLNELKKYNNKMSSLNLTNENSALNLAESIKGIPMIYYPFGLQAVATRFKNSLQENAKIHASTEDIMEFCHNGIVAWEKPSDHIPILIQGVDDYVKTKERWRIVEKFFSENNIKFLKITSTSGSILTKIINLIYLLDMTSIFLAINHETDPTYVKSIEYIKKNLK